MWYYKSVKNKDKKIIFHTISVENTKKNFDYMTSMHLSSGTPGGGCYSYKPKKICKRFVHEKEWFYTCWVTSGNYNFGDFIFICDAKSYWFDKEWK